MNPRSCSSVLSRRRLGKDAAGNAIFATSLREVAVDQDQELSVMTVLLMGRAV